MRYTHAEKRFGTTVEITVISEDVRTPTRMGYVFDYFLSIEEEFSRFRPDSSLSLLNTYKTLSVSSRFVELLEFSRSMHQRTDGLFNPLVNVANLGYGRSFDEGVFEPTKAPSDLDFSKVSVHDGIVSMGENQTLDFGGIAKGYAVDTASDILLAFGYDDFFVNAGGDVYVHGKNEQGERWVVGVENPFEDAFMDHPIATLSLQDCAIATSGSYKRKWDVRGEKHHHLMNPRTLENETKMLSVTLIAPRCALADAFTKSIFNLPIADGLRRIEENAMEGLILATSGQLFYTRGLIERYGFAIANEFA